MSANLKPDRAWLRTFLAVARRSAKRRLQSFNEWYSGHLVPRIVGPLVLGGPTALFCVAQFHGGISSWLTRNLPWTILAASLGVLAAILKGLMDLAGVSESLERQNLLLLFQCVDHVVGNKLRRFGECAQRSQGKSRQPGDVFNEITQPQEQMKLLVEGVWHWFNRTKNDDSVSVRVVLARMDGEHVDDWEFYFPADRPPKSPPSVFRRPRSGYSQAQKRRKLVIVEDVDAESAKGNGAKFLSTEEKDEDYPGGSLLCYPVWCGNTHRAPYVLSVYADRRNFFRAEKKQGYEFVLATFSKRILIEYHLKRLKEDAGERHVRPQATS